MKQSAFRHTDVVKRIKRTCLKVTLSISTGKKGDVSDSECGKVAGARWTVREYPVIISMNLQRPTDWLGMIGSTQIAPLEHDVLDCNSKITQNSSSKVANLIYPLISSLIIL